MADKLESNGKCRSCGARVHWVTLNPSGKRNPLDLDPVPGGNVALTALTDGQGGTVARVLTKAEIAARAVHVGEVRDLLDVEPAVASTAPLYVSHFSTCEQADSWRSR